MFTKKSVRMLSDLGPLSTIASGMPLYDECKVSTPTCTQRPRAFDLCPGRRLLFFLASSNCHRFAIWLESTFLRPPARSLCWANLAGVMQPPRYEPTGNGVCQDRWGYWRQSLDACDRFDNRVAAPALLSIQTSSPCKNRRRSYRDTAGAAAGTSGYCRKTSASSSSSRWSLTM